MTAVACPVCGKTDEMTDRPLYCRGEGTFHNGHDFRMLTINELISKHASDTEAGYDTAAIRILRAMENLING
jgi:hypothetical protein